MSEKEVYAGADRLKGWFYRQLVSHVVRKVEAFAYNRSLPVFASSTYEAALRGNKVFVEVVEVLKEFEEHVEENLRQYYLPPEPPLTREEMIEWVKENMTQTWLYNCLQIAGLPFSTFSNFFNPIKGVSEDVSTKIIDGIHGWYQDLVEKFNYYEARYDRFEERGGRGRRSLPRYANALLPRFGSNTIAPTPHGQRPRRSSTLAASSCSGDRATTPCLTSIACCAIASRQKSTRSWVLSTS